MFKHTISVVLFVFVLSSGTVRAQGAAINIGYQETEDYSSVTWGVTSLNFMDLEFFIGTIGSDEDMFAGGRVGYVFPLVGEEFSEGPNLYIGPHIGGYYREQSGGSKLSLNYGGTAGFYIFPLNLAVSYGIDDLMSTQYISFKIGFDLTVP